MERGGAILVNNDNSLLSIAWPQEPIICQLLGIIIYIGICGTFPHKRRIEFLFQKFNRSNKIKT